MQLLATSGCKARNASTTIAIPNKDRPNATTSNPITESCSFDMTFAAMSNEIPITITKRYVSITASNPATVLLT